MKSFKMSRILAVLAICTTSFTIVGVGAASAATTSSQTTNSAGVLPPGPSGCNPGNFCTYEQGNGGTLCEQMNSTSNLSGACIPATDSVFNNSSVNVKIYYGLGNTGAFY